MTRKAKLIEVPLRLSMNKAQQLVKIATYIGVTPEVLAQVFIGLELLKMQATDPLVKKTLKGRKS